MIAAVRTRLWSSFRQRCESPLLAHPETLVSCLLGRSRVFPDFLPASRGTLVPSGCLHAANPSSLPGIWPKLEPQLPAPARPGGWADKPLGLVSAARHQSSVWESLRFALCTPVAALSSVAPKVPPHHSPSLPVKGLPSVWKLFLLHCSLPEVQVLSLFFCLCFFFYLLPYPGMWGVSCLLGSLRSFASVQ